MKCGKAGKPKASEAGVDCSRQSMLFMKGDNDVDRGARADMDGCD